MSSKCYHKIRTEDGCTTNRDPDCQEKIEMCKTDVEYYHNICDRYWDMTQEEIDDMEEKDVDQAIMQIDLCVMLREKHNSVCVQPACRDSGHIGAIRKLKRRLVQVKDRLYQLKLQDAYEKLLSGKLSPMDIKLKRPEEKVVFPELYGDEVYAVDFVNQVANLSNAQIIQDSKKGKDGWILVGLEFPSGKSIIEVENATLPFIVWKKLADTLVELYAKKDYKKIYYKKS